MSTPRIRLGKIGEGLARRHLESVDYRVIAANVRTRSGDIDLVAEHDRALVFVEVRTRRGTGTGTPEESITPRKRSKMTATAQENLQAHGSEEREWRIDVVAVEIGHDGRLRRIDIVENAVEA